MMEEQTFAQTECNIQVKMVQDVQYHEIDDQIKVREYLIGQMVGSLYPQVLQGEIDKLKNLKQEFISEKDMEL